MHWTQSGVKDYYSGPTFKLDYGRESCCRKKATLGRRRLRWDDIIKKDVESLSGGPDRKTRWYGKSEDWMCVGE